MGKSETDKPDRDNISSSGRKRNHGLGGLILTEEEIQKWHEGAVEDVLDLIGDHGYSKD